ncbi:MAG: Gfo/Idh/MocA family oxidoreductase [Clostridia bacterium]|nr:Gfo/Idh/MocA family oxidoreductase [Clostridia bacterium]
MKRIGIIGVGGIANNVHIKELLDVPECRITAICDINPTAIEKAKERLGDVLSFTDYKELIDSGEIDAVEICTPNHLHVEIAEYAVRKGIPVNVEKPLGLSVESCERLGKVIAETGVHNMMCFSYRFKPAVRWAKDMIDKGLIGDIVTVNVEYSKSSAFWQGRRLDWRFVKKYAGTGVLGDLGVHLIDMAQLLVGDFKSVSATTGIVVKERQLLDSEEWGKVETDDYCNFIAKLSDRRNGKPVSATFAITRCALGHANTIRYDVYGTEGCISFNLNDPGVLTFCTDKKDGFSATLETVPVPEEYNITQEKAFIDSLDGKFCDYFPTVNDGIKCQKILDSVEKSAEEKVIVAIN